MRLVLTSLACLFATEISWAQQFDQDQFHYPSFGTFEEPSASLGIADLSTVRPIGPKVVGLLKDFEGWRTDPYNDAVGYCTVGYGHLIALKRCEEIDPLEYADGLSLEDGEALLLEDAVSPRAAVQALVKVELSDGQFGALSSFVFNLGANRLQKSTLLRLLNEGETELAAGQFALWVKGGDRILPGLVARRACEEAMFRGYIEAHSTIDFTRSECVSLGAAPGAGDYIDVFVGE